MKTAKIAFTEQKRAIDVRGKVFGIPSRTSKIENALQEWETSRRLKTDYENYYSVFEILFGAEQRDELLENGEDENLDFLFVVCTTALDLYNEEKDKITTANMQNAMKQINPLLDKMGGLNAVAKQLK